MRKGILLNVTLWIEGEDEPVHNFAESTMKAVKEILASQAMYPDIQITVRKIGEDKDTEHQDEA